MRWQALIYSVMTAADDRVLPGLLPVAAAAATSTATTRSTARWSCARRSRSPATSTSTRSPSAWGSTACDEFMKAFGYGELTGIDIPRREARPATPRRNGSSAPSSAPADQVWFPGETISMGIGQGYHHGDAAAAGAFRRGDRRARPDRRRPRLVTGMRDGRLRPGHAAASRVPEPPVTLAQPRTMVGRLRRHGRAHRPTAPRRSPDTAPGTRIAGKTGTAQVFTIKQNENYHAPRSPTSAGATTPGSSPLRRPKTRRSPLRCWSRTAGSAPRGGADRTQGARRLPAADRRRAEAADAMIFEEVCPSRTRRTLTAGGRAAARARISTAR